MQFKKGRIGREELKKAHDALKSGKSVSDLMLILNRPRNTIENALELVEPSSNAGRLKGGKSKDEQLEALRQTLKGGAEDNGNKKKGKQRGRQSQYSDEQKSAFIDAVKNGRKADASWSEILEATKTQGYKGSLPYLKILAAKGGALNTRRDKLRKTLKSLPYLKKMGMYTGFETEPKKRGRPKGSKNAKSAASNGAGLGDIERIVAGMVETRVKASIGQAIKALETAARELQSL
jgi:hypothetical protein